MTKNIKSLDTKNFFMTSGKKDNMNQLRHSAGYKTNSSTKFKNGLTLLKLLLDILQPIIR